MNIDSLKGRFFQMWEFRVSHRCLLLMSTRTDDIDTRICVLFLAADHLSIDTTFIWQSIVEEKTENPTENIFRIQSDKGTQEIRALAMLVEQDDKDWHVEHILDRRFKT